MGRNPQCGRGGGFTLVELLVVIAVITILASLLMPVVMQGMVSAMTASCKSGLRQIGAATRLYTQNNGNMFLRHGQARWQGEPYFRPANLMRPAVLVDAYLPQESEVWICAADAATQNRGVEWWLASYPFNGLLSLVSEGQIKRPSQIISVLCGPHDAGWIEFQPPHGHDDPPYMKPQLQQYRRHRERFNAIFCDLHVDLLKANDTAREDFDPAF